MVGGWLVRLVEGTGGRTGGQTRRKAPGYRMGRTAIRFCLYHQIGFDVASSLTLVGWTRVSIGPAIRVMLRGCAACCDWAITAVAARAPTPGLQTPPPLTPGPVALRKALRGLVKAARTDRPLAARPLRALLQV